MIVIFGAMAHLSNLAILLGIVILSLILMFFRLFTIKIFLRGLLIALIPIFLLLSVNNIYR